MSRRALAALALLAACGDSDAAPPDATPGIDAAPTSTRDEPRTLAAGEIVEGTFSGGPPARVVIQLSAPTADIEFNLHGHANGGTQVVHEEFGQMATSYEFAPTSDAEWFLLLRNGSDTTPLAVDVHLEFYGTLGWSGWEE